MDENNIIQIERFLEGEMDSEERAAFEAQLQRDEELRETMSFYQDLQTTIERKGAIQEVHQELKAENFFTTTTQEETAPAAKIVQMRPKNRRRWLAYAASFLVLVTAGSLFYSNSNYSNQALAGVEASNILSLFDQGNLKGNADVENNLSTGLSFLADEEYEQAVTFFRSIETSNERYETAQLYLAYAQLANDNPKQAQAAAENLQQITEDQTLAYRAEWIIIQAQLQQGQTSENFQTRLATFANQQGRLQEEAQALQVELSSFWRQLIF
ncbi:MAG: hypothetical protein AAGI23_03690 [Bacteroidota bacterium]